MDWGKKALREAIFADIREQAKATNCVFVRIRPQIEETPKNRELFRNLGLKPAPIYLSVEYAGILDLNKTEEEILAGAAQVSAARFAKLRKMESPFQLVPIQKIFTNSIRLSLKPRSVTALLSFPRVS
jgi:hypothetical protein